MLQEQTTVATKVATPSLFSAKRLTTKNAVLRFELMEPTVDLREAWLLIEIKDGELGGDKRRKGQVTQTKAQFLGRWQDHKSSVI